MNTSELQEVISELIGLVRRFPENERSVKHFAEWTIREVIAHIAGWNLQRIGELEEFMQGKEIEIINNYDVFNRQVIRQKRYYAWEQLQNEFEQSCRDLATSFASVPEEMADQKVWSGKTSTPTSWLQVDIEHLHDEHVVTVRKILAELSVTP